MAAHRPHAELDAGKAADVDRRVAECVAESVRFCDGWNYSAALRIVDSAIAESPADARLHLARGDVLQRWGRIREALAEFEAAERSGMRERDDYLRLAQASLSLGRVAAGVHWLENAAAADPGRWQSHLELAGALQMHGRIPEAIAEYEKVVAIEPANVAAIGNIGVCRIAIGEFEAAERAFRQVIDSAPNDARAWINLGVSLFRQDRIDAAKTAVARAQELAAKGGGDEEALCNVAIYLDRSGQPDEAISIYERVLPGAPDPNLHFAFAIPLLRTGRFADGWSQHEFRWLKMPLSSTRAEYARPVWNGQALAGKTILIRGEHGLGDTLQFLRYARLVKALGPTVLLQAQPQLAALAEAVPGVDRVVDESYPEEGLDFYVNVMSLPKVFGSTFESIPCSMPYLSVPDDAANAWQSQLGQANSARVGLVWAGGAAHVNDRQRSMPFATMAPLLQLEGAQFYALQKGVAAVELEIGAKTMINFGPQLCDLGDTAALISQLDLVVTVDTAVAHVAGALGKPVWVLLSEPADWRWLTGREDSPWYPTARLFRQKRRGDWDEVIGRVKEALREWVAGGGKAPELPKRSELVPKPRAGLAPRRISGLSAVTEARVGIVQYFPDDEPMGSSLEWYGEWLQGQLELMLRWVRAGGVGMEVGAGVGAHAIALGEALGPEGHLFLYEGRPVVKRVLSQNLGANRIGNVTLMRRMLGGPGGEETLDELQLTRLDWLKVNAPVEAQAILAGGEQTLWRLRPVLLLGVTAEAELMALAEQVKGYGYRCWRIDTPLYDPANFNRRDDDLYAGQSALALAAVPEETDADTVVVGRAEV